MNRAELSKYSASLNAKHQELWSRLGKRDGIAIERAPDALDEVQFTADRAFATGRLEQETRLANEVRAALRRVENGEYGTCLHCDGQISAKRLRAVPWARFCIACQERADRNPREAAVDEEGLLVAAA